MVRHLIRHGIRRVDRQRQAIQRRKQEYDRATRVPHDHATPPNPAQLVPPSKTTHTHTLTNSQMVKFWLWGGVLAYIGFITYKSLTFVYLIITAFVIFLALESLIEAFTRIVRKRSIAISLTYVLLLIILLSGIIVMVPFVINQLVNIGREIINLIRDIVYAINTSGLDQYINSSFLPPIIKESIIDTLTSEGFGREVERWITNNSSAITDFIGSNIANSSKIATDFLQFVGSTIFQTLIVLITAIFFSIEKQSVISFLGNISGRQSTIPLQMEKVFHKLGLWFKGQLYLSLIIFVATRFGLYILGWFGVDLENKITLALIAGLMEFIPMIGPWIGAIPAVLMAISLYQFNGFIATVLLYLIIQQLEGNVLIPVVLNKAVGVSQLVIFLAILLGGTTLGFIGIVIAVPVAAIIAIIYEDFANRQRLQSNTPDHSQDALHNDTTTSTTTPTETETVE